MFSFFHQFVPSLPSIGFSLGNDIEHRPTGLEDIIASVQEYLMGFFDDIAVIVDGYLQLRFVIVQQGNDSPLDLTASSDGSAESISDYFCIIPDVKDKVPAPHQGNSSPPVEEWNIIHHIEQSGGTFKWRG